MEHRRGTCIDLTLLFCAALERCGVRSLLTLGLGPAGGHAWVGCVSPNIIPPKVLVLDRQVLYKLEEEQALLMLDAIAFTHSEMEFDQALEAGSNHLHSKDHFKSVWAVHIANCHAEGAAPMGMESR